ncbi:acyl-CoA thioesterase [Stagnihabitans tardus]|uniref:Acyl-CoA thioesterase n=1 Tax=Stagnihabitans tardus TaxID=2699202 RepID=A0AAE5BUQ0_9RHOB|nr:thioesterase family protein [Stagnihabitans tardus]NBZ86358.1 acyl-CoA thioesterase [Stagnihabitans tardus]
MTYRRQIRVEFNHCDPAGIVFYPRYFEMTNSLCENFFRDELGLPYEAMMAENTGVPTVRLEAEFKAPSRLGELLTWVLVVERIGGSSVTFRAEVPGRLTIRLTLVYAPNLKPAPWTAPLRAALAAHLETPDAT